MIVLLTRAQERCRRSAQRLATAGHAAVILPLTRYRDTGLPIPAGDFDAIAFTSAAAADSLGRRIPPESPAAGLRDVRAFCVGRETAKAASAAGFRTVIASEGDAAALARKIASDLRCIGRKPRLLYPAQAHAAFDLGKALPGMDVIAFTAYEAEAVDPGKAAFLAALDASDAAFLYSERSARHILDLVLRHATPDRLKRLTLIAISEKTARAIGEGPGSPVLVAETPDENAMIQLLRART